MGHDIETWGEHHTPIMPVVNKQARTKPGEVATAQIHGDIDEDTSNALNKFIEQKRLLDTTKGQVKENEDGATFSN